MTVEQRQQVLAAVHCGNKIEAIRIHREATGAGLAESKAFIEALERNPEAADGPVTGQTHSLTKGEFSQIEAALFAGNKIEAIKLHRMATGSGLYEAKQAMDALEDRLRATHPGKIPPRAKGCGAAVFLIVLGFALSAVLVTLFFAPSVFA